MIKNSKGMTLIELLGALTLSVVIFSLIFSIFNMGSKSYKTDLDANALQTDATIVMSDISSSFYKKNAQPFPIEVRDGAVYLNNSNEPVSNSELDYKGSTFSWHQGLLTVHLVIHSRGDNAVSPFEVKTTLNYPWKETGNEK